MNTCPLCNKNADVSSYRFCKHIGTTAHESDILTIKCHNCGTYQCCLPLTLCKEKLERHKEEIVILIKQAKKEEKDFFLIDEELEKAICEERIKKIYSDAKKNGKYLIKNINELN